MDAYESDSSGDGAAYTETPVLLGYPSKTPTDDSISHLGGLPTWIDGKTTPSGSFAKCKVCNDYMSLLLQLNGDMPDKFPGHERWLYIFGCRRKACRRKDGCIRGLRGTRRFKVKSPERKASTPSTTAPTSNLGASLFGGSPFQQANMPANPFSSTGSNSTSSPNPFSGVSALAAKPPQKVDTESLPATFAEKARIATSPATQSSSAPLESWPEQCNFPPAYPIYFLEAEYETIDAPPTPKPSQSLPNIEPAEGGSTDGGREDKVLFESTMDKSFQKFADRVAQNPEQAIRYEFNGSPLLYSTTDAVGRLLSPGAARPEEKVKSIHVNRSPIPACTTCGATRVFEVQLMPQAITSLEEDEMSIDGMDWGTIILGVCSNDCVPPGISEKEPGYVEEWVGVQWEELEDRRK